MVELPCRIRISSQLIKTWPVQTSRSPNMNLHILHSLHPLPKRVWNQLFRTVCIDVLLSTSVGRFWFLISCWIYIWLAAFVELQDHKPLEKEAAALTPQEEAAAAKAALELYRTKEDSEKDILQVRSLLQRLKRFRGCVFCFCRPTSRGIIFATSSWTFRQPFAWLSCQSSSYT